MARKYPKSNRLTKVDGTGAGKNMEFYDPKTGRRFKVTAGLGGKSYGLFERKPNGSLRRVKQVHMSPELNEVTTSSELYAGKKGWRNGSRL